MLRLLLLLSSVTLLAGCLNLDLPSSASLTADGGNGTGPSLDSNSLIGQQVGSASQVSFDVEDVDGVARVSLGCSGITLITWTEPPYSGTVNFAPCQVVGTPSDAGSGLVDVVLTVTALDTQGNLSQASFTVTLDTQTASISTDLPPRVRPGRALDFQITVDRPIRGTPAVKLGDQVPVVTPTADPLVFDAHLDGLPLLGVDGYQGPPPAPASVLEDVERSLDTTIEVVAENGNPSRLQQTVLLSRVIWDRPLPAPIFEPTIETPDPVNVPVATTHGLTVPLKVSLVGGQRGIQWVPAEYGLDGGLTTVDALGDGGYSAIGFDSDGKVLAEDVNNVAYFDVPSPQTPISLPDPWFVDLPTRVGAGICDVNSSSGGPMPVVCMEANGTMYDASAPPFVLSNGYSQPPFTVGSGKALLIAGVTSVTGDSLTSTWIVGLPGSGSFSAEQFYDAGTGYSSCGRNTFDVLPTGDGRFAVFDQIDCMTAAGAQVSRLATESELIGSQGEHLGSYAIYVGQGDSVVSVLGDGRVVSLRPGTPSSTLFFWPSDAGTPEGPILVPGFYQYPQVVGTTPPPSPRDAVTSTRGLAMLTATSDFTRALIQLDGSNNPRWIYRYPRVADTDSLHLYGAPGSPLVYLVDTFNQRVIAIEP